MKLSLILILLFAIIIAVFAVQNIAQVTVTLLFWKVEVSLVIVILVALTFGAIMVFLIDLGARIGISKERKELNAKVSQLTEENERLRKASGPKSAPAAQSATVTKDGETPKDTP